VSAGADGTAAFKLSPQQARLWAHPAGEAALARAVLVLEGALERERLRAALSDLVERHEILRTSYRRLPGTSAAAQSPSPPRPLALEVIALPDGTEASRLAQLADLPPGSAPLTATLAELAPDRHALALTLPALSTDRRGLVNLARALAERYAARGVAQPLPLPPAVQYADVAALFNDLLDASESDAGRRYWRAVELAPLLEAALPPDTTATATAGPLGAHVLPIDDVALAAAASAAGVPAELLLLAAWQALVYRLTSRGAWSIAVVADGRAYEGLDVMLGRFERALPLSGPVDGRASLVTLARHCAAERARALPWQDDFDLDRLLGDRAAAHASGFPLAFAALDWPDPVDAGGVRMSLVALAAPPAGASAELTCVRRGGGLVVELCARDPDAARLGERLTTLLDAALARPDAPLDSLPIIGAGEAALLERWNQTARDWPLDAGVAELFAAQARRTPTREAVRAGTRALSYAELASRSSQLAHHLRGLGVAGEARVGICLERSVEQVVALLAVLKAGAAYVPLDPMVPKERIAYMLAEARVDVIVSQRTLRELLPDGARVVRLDDEAEAALIAQAPADAPRLEAHPEMLAYVIFTSGSTGRPKGVMIEQRSVVNLASALRAAIYEGQGDGLRVSLNAPLAFDASVKQWVQLLAGHTLCIVPEAARPDGARMCAWIEAERIDVLDCTPSQLATMVPAGLGTLPERSPRLVLVGGEAIDAAAWRTLAAAPHTTFVNVYGPTECTVDATTTRVTAASLPSIGRPLGNVRARLVDGAITPLPLGVTGELAIGGHGVARGYCGQPGLTAERFVPDPDGPAGARLYRTGDLARLRSDGNLEYLGRSDGQVKLRGLRIELGEIEAQLDALPGVRAAVVVVRPSPTGEPQLVGYVVSDGASGEAVAGWRAALRRELPEYMVPAALVPLAALPLTPNGKLDRAALPDPAALVADDAPFEAPTSEIERTVAAIWQEVLGVPRVGLHQNFFDLGGHSLLTMQMHERLSQAFGRELSMVELFRHPTVAALSQYLAASAEVLARDGDAAARAERQRAARERQAQRNKTGRGR
jgi:amino acid adenylation domain-containing protein